MADAKQFELLERGIVAWNDWRRNNPEIEVNLQGADFERANLGAANLREANLIQANLIEANLSGANLSKAHLNGANLIGANLHRAQLMDAVLDGAMLSRSILTSANFIRAQAISADFTAADLRDTKLISANLDEAILNEAILSGADLTRTRLAQAQFGNTVLAICDLNSVVGIEEIKHRGPSSIGIETIRLFKGNIRDTFLRGCGLSDWEIESAKLYIPDLSNDEIVTIQNRIFELRGQQPLQMSSLFISYSHADGAFVDKLEPQFMRKGIRFWRDVHHATAGRLEKVIDRAIRLNPTVLLVLSNDSIQSDWVEHEVNDARKLEKELARDVLCPVALSEEWKRPNSWSQVLMDQVKKYNILDFSQWNDDSKFNEMFGRLVEGLDLYYKK